MLNIFLNMLSIFLNRLYTHCSVRGFCWFGWSAGRSWCWFFWSRSGSGWSSSSAGRSSGWFGGFNWGLLLGPYSKSMGGRYGSWSAGSGNSWSSGSITTISCSNWRIGLTISFVGFLLAESFTLDLYTDFDLGLPILGTHGVWWADLILGLPTLDADAVGLSAIWHSTSLFYFRTHLKLNLAQNVLLIHNSHIYS